MIPSRSLAVAAVLVLSSTASAQTPNEAQSNVNVTRVTLATGGLAHVEGRMASPGEAMRLAIERAQVADVLRTLVVTGSAPVRSIDLEAAEPVGERSATGRLLAGNLSDPATVLGSLIGEIVEVRGGANQLSGRLLSFEAATIPGTEETPDRPALRIAVATADGRVAYATFEALSTLAIEGAAVAERMAEVVPALAESVDDGRRELVVQLEGVADAGFSFVVPTTVWRPSYRAIIDGDDVELQGWGTLENTTGLDWNDIDLRLAVGTPVAYRQDVYAPLRTTRPSAPFEVGRTAEVPIVEQAEATSAVLRVQPTRESMVQAQGRALGLEARAPQADAEAAADLVTGGPAVAGSASTVFPVAGRIDLAAGRTLTVPFLDGSEQAERIVYVSVSGNRQPMDALELGFDAEATVPGGLIAVYDGDGFVGDARFAGADGGERTILPFAASANVDIKVVAKPLSRLTRARIEDGTLRLRREMVREFALAIDADEPGALVADIDSASGEDFTLAASAGSTGEIARVDDGLVRLRASLPEGAAEITVTGTRPQVERYLVSNIPTYVLEEVIAAGGTVDAATVAALKERAATTARIAEIDRRVGTLQADVSDLREAVAADRENLEAIDVSTPEGAAVRERIIARTNEIDAALSTLRDLRQQRLAEERKLRGS